MDIGVRTHEDMFDIFLSIIVIKVCNLRNYNNLEVIRWPSRMIQIGF